MSHHAPCDLNRTWKIFGVHVCVRCLAMAIAGGVTLLVGLVVGFPIQPFVIVTSILLILPSGVDFTLEELWSSYPASNFMRFVTGAIFGVGGGVCLAWWIDDGSALPFIAFVVASVAMQFAIAYIFQRRGHLERYLSRYEEAIRLCNDFHESDSMDTDIKRGNENV